MTTNTHVSTVCQQLPIRVRVAFSLLVAERVMPSLVEISKAFGVARSALDYCWQWEEGVPVRAIQLYERNDKGLVLQGSLFTNGHVGAAISTVTSAFYYTLWQAFCQDLENGLVAIGEVPLMSDMTEEVLDDLCNSAKRTSFCDDSWLDSLLRKLVRDFRTGNANDLGPVVSRDYCVE